MPARNPDAGGNSLGETKSAAEAGKHVTNIATITAGTRNEVSLSMFSRI